MNQLWSRLLRLRQARLTRAALEPLDDQLLKDIGIPRSGIE